jgi:thiol-disulfide isomerase/thioredoxin
MTVEATPSAERYLAGSGTAADVRALATLLTSVNDSEHGRFDKAIGRFRTLLADRQRTAASDPMALLGVGETFLRRLIRAGRYDEARQFCSLLADASGEPEVSAHFASSLKSLKLVGRAAPTIDAIDVDGRRVRLSDLKGKVVLVTFWASWCPPCLDAFPRLNAVQEKYRGRGLEIIGVNLDAHHEDVKDVKTAMPIVRHVLVHNGVTWANVLNDEGNDSDIARAYGVESVPTNALIGTDGTILGVSIGEPELEAAILKALASGSRKR